MIDALLSLERKSNIKLPLWRQINEKEGSLRLWVSVEWLILTVEKGLDVRSWQNEVWRIENYKKKKSFIL